MSASAIKATSGPTGFPPTPTNGTAVTTKPPNTMNTVGKQVDETHNKQVANSDDNSTVFKGPQRQASQKTAWSKGSPNPITGRASGITNGVAVPAKNAPLTASTTTHSKESVTPDRAMSDRIVFLLSNCVGLPCTLDLKSGESFTGIFSASSLQTAEPAMVLKMVKKSSNLSNTQTNAAALSVADEYIGTGSDHAVAFSLQTIANLSVDHVRFETISTRKVNGTSSDFRTDTDISGNVTRGERTLQKWEGPMDTAVDLSLDSDTSIGGWDQFRDNERKFGLKTNYDETFYTTALNKNHKDYKKWEADASRMAREIEGSGAASAHIAEERGLKVDDSGMDEEMKYSGVVKGPEIAALQSGQPNKYTPPARRPPTGQSTVSGAPVDDAIISATLAKAGPVVTPPQPESAEVKSSSIAVNTLPQAMGPASTSSEITEKAAQPSQTAVETRTHISDVPTKTSPVIKPSQATTNALRAAEGGATATVERDVVSAFKEFSATEKLRVANQQRTLARQDKAVKLNDLKKFAANFKLNTPVPQDLIPILAKDKIKQEEIVQKNKSNATDKQTTPPRQPSTAATPTTDKVGKMPTSNERVASAQNSGAERQAAQRNRQSQGNFPQSLRGDRSFQGQQLPQIPGRQGPGHLTQRLHMNSMQNRALPVNMAGMHQHNGTQDPRVPLSAHSPGAGGMLSPRFNVQAMEFKPNPSAHTFQPGQPSSDRSSPVKDLAASRRASVLKPKPGNFFEGRRGIIAKDKRIDLEAAFNPIRRMKKQLAAENHSKDYPQNLGIPPAFRTAPVWDVPPANQDRTYQQVFEAQQPLQSSAPVGYAGVPQQPAMPHQQQLPLHVQQGRHPQQFQGHQQTPRHMPLQPGFPSAQTGSVHYEDHQMRFSQSSNSAHPSPRPGMVHPGQAPQPIAAYPNVVPYAVTPNGYPMAVRQVSNSGPHHMHGQHMGGHMMMQTPSNGPYAQVHMTPQQQGYTLPGQVYAQQMQAQQLGPNGYGSPRGPAPMMIRQGSTQGPMAQQMFMPQGQMQYMAPQGGPMTPMRNPAAPYTQQHQMVYNVSPHQSHYGGQHGSHRGTPSVSYAQPILPFQQMAGMPPQMAVAATAMPNGPVDGQEEVK